MFGLEFLGEGQHKYVFLVGAWKVLDIRPFWRGICCHSLYPDSHHMWQDNDPKHTSNSTKKWMKDNAIEHWITPPESPVSIQTLPAFTLYISVMQYYTQYIIIGFIPSP